MNFSTQDRKLTEQEKTARSILNRAISLDLQGNRAGAIKAIRQALALAPSLAVEKFTLNLAQELTGLPAKEAILRLTSIVEGKTLEKAAKSDDRQTAKTRPVNISVYALVFLTTALAVMLVFGFVSGKFENSFQKLRLFQQRTNLQKSDGYEYYLFVPDGTAPEGGWPVVVAFHGYGGRAEQMLWLADGFVSAGAIFVAPTYGEYNPYPGDGPIEQCSHLLKGISEKYPLQSRGAILLGLSQGGSFAFRFSLRHPEQVYSVVTAGAPEYDQVFSSPPSMPYYFTWGELDGLQDYVIPGHVRPLQQAGYDIKTYVIPGYGHEVMPFAVELTLNLIR
jgi:predicted esterase